jgi:hypothetical protein
METDAILQEFTARLHEICDDMEIVAGRGRQSALALHFHVSPNAARKWLLGQGLPALEMAIRIASWAGVNVTWLLQGVGPKRGDKIDTTPGELFEAINHLQNDDSQQVFDFIRYKIERSEGWLARNKLGAYMALVDKMQKHGKREDK